MQNLGRISVLFLSLCATVLYADIVAEVSPQVLYKGDEATYMLKITGEKVQKPLISSLCGTDVTGSRSQTTISMVNSDYKKSYTLSYTFVPQKSCEIPPMSFEVDGKVEHSNGVKVVVKKPVQDKSADFVLSLKPSKRELFVGEPFTLKLLFRQKKGAQAVDSKFIAPDFKGFWVKGKPKTIRSEDDKYIYTKALYRVAPQREGNLTIAPAEIKIAKRVNSRDSWGMMFPEVKWKSYFSNEVNIVAKALPHKAKLVGNFTLDAKADKLTIHPNEAVNVTLTVTGDGNLEDIGSFKPYIDGVNVFAEKVHINGNRLSQKLAFVSDKDFTIPAFSLAFYNLKTKRVEKIWTKPIDIKVTGSAKEKSDALEVKKAKVPSQNLITTRDVQRERGVNTFWLVVTFVLGAIFGAAFIFLKPREFFKREKKFSMKNEKLLLVKLLPFKEQDDEVRRVVDILEGNIYYGKNEKIEKKLLKELIKRYNIS